MAKMITGGTAFGGVPLGILVLNARYPLMPGNMAHAATFDFPVRYKVVDLPTGWWQDLSEEKYQRFIRAAKELEAEGVRAITTGCGLFVVWQKRAAEDLHVPIFTSPLLMAPMISKVIGVQRKLGIITAAGKRLDEPHFLEASGIDKNVPFVIGELDACSEFMDCIRHQRKAEMDTTKFQKQVVQIAKDIIQRDPAVGAFLLECSAIPPFSAAIAEETGMPVFDFVALTDMMYRALIPKTF